MGAPATELRSALAETSGELFTSYHQRNMEVRQWLVPSWRGRTVDSRRHRFAAARLTVPARSSCPRLLRLTHTFLGYANTSQLCRTLIRFCTTSAGAMWSSLGLNPASS